MCSVCFVCVFACVQPDCVHGACMDICLRAFLSLSYSLFKELRKLSVGDPSSREGGFKVIK